MCSTSRHGIGVKEDVQAQQTNLQNTRTRRSGILTVMDRPPGIFFVNFYSSYKVGLMFEFYFDCYFYSTTYFTIIVSTK